MPVNNTTKVYILLVMGLYFVLLSLLYAGYGAYVNDTKYPDDPEGFKANEYRQYTDIGFLGYVRSGFEELPAWINLIFLGVPAGIVFYIFISMLFAGGGG